MVMEHPDIQEKPQWLWWMVSKALALLIAMVIYNLQGAGNGKAGLSDMKRISIVVINGQNWGGLLT